MAKSLLRAKKFQERIDVKHSKFYQMLKDGELPPAAVHIGRLPLWTSDQVERWINERIAQAQANPPAKNTTLKSLCA